MIEKITTEQADAMIDTRKPLGLFYVLKDGVYIGIDNSHGHAWTEEFLNLCQCKRWLNNPDVMAPSVEKSKCKGMRRKDRIPFF